MPKIGTGRSAKHFAYTETGMQAAREESARTGKPLDYSMSMPGRKRKAKAKAKAEHKTR